MGEASWAEAFVTRSQRQELGLTDRFHQQPSPPPSSPPTTTTTTTASPSGCNQDYYIINSYSRWLIQLNCGERGAYGSHKSIIFLPFHPFFSTYYHYKSKTMIQEYSHTLRQSIIKLCSCSWSHFMGDFYLLYDFWLKIELRSNNTAFSQLDFFWRNMGLLLKTLVGSRIQCCNNKMSHRGGRHKTHGSV